MILALDLGTSGAKGALIADDGTVTADGQADYPTVHLPGGGAEQDPGEWIAAAHAVIQAVVDSAPSAARIEAISLTGQMQDLVLLPADRPAPEARTAGDLGGGTGAVEQLRALAPAILYTDTRSAADARAITDQLPEWASITGAASTPDATSTAAHWHRLRREQPELIQQTGAVVLGPAGYLAWMLGCGTCCDLTTASTTGLLAAGSRRWSDQVCAAAGLDPALLPRLAEGIVGHLDERGAALLGLPASGIPIVLAPGDAAATTLGTVGLEVGDAYVYLGTSGWAAWVAESEVSTDMRDREAVDDDAVDRVADIRDAAAHRLALAGDGARRELRIAPILAAGGAAHWARDAFLAGASPEQADALLASRLRDRGRGPAGPLALPSIHGERYPVRAPHLGAAIVDMDPSTRAIDVYAAVLEGVAHALAHALGPVEAGSVGDTKPLVVAGGGAASEPWLRILADVTGRPVRRAPGGDAAVLGAAIAGARALGRDLPRPGGEQEPIMPDPPAHAAYREQAGRHRALYDLLG